MYYNFLKVIVQDEQSSTKNSGCVIRKRNEGKDQSYNGDVDGPGMPPLLSSVLLPSQNASTDERTEAEYE